MKVKARSRQKRTTSDPQDLRRKNGQVTWYTRFLTAFSLSLCSFTLQYIWKLYFHLQYDHFRLSLKRGFSRCGHGFSGCDGLGVLGGFDRLGGFGGFTQFSGLVGFDRLRGFDGFGGFSGFDGYPMLSLKGFSVSFTLLLNILCLLVSYPLSYTWLKREPQISIRKERFIRRHLQYGVLGDCVF